MKAPGRCMHTLESPESRRSGAGGQYRDHRSSGARDPGAHSSGTGEPFGESPGVRSSGIGEEHSRRFRVDEVGELNVDSDSSSEHDALVPFPYDGGLDSDGSRSGDEEIYLAWTVQRELCKPKNREFFWSLQGIAPCTSGEVFKQFLEH